VLSAVGRPFAFILAPSESFAFSQRDAVATGAILAVLNVCVAWSFLPVLLSGVPSGIASSPTRLAFILSIQAVVLILMLAFRWTVSTYLAWSIGAATGSSSDKLPYLAVVLLADTVLLLREALVGVILWLIRRDLNATLEIPRLGLDLFVDASSPILRTILSQFSVFTIWYIIVMVVGLERFARVPKAKGTVIVSFIWVVLLAIALLSSRGSL
jgi:hypothetical protein